MKLAVIGGTREADALIDAAKLHGLTLDPLADLVVIASHPFDTDLIECALLSAKDKACILLQRPKWQPDAGDHWSFAKSAKDAAKALKAQPSKRALLAVGNGRLAPFYRLSGIDLFVRSRNKPHPPTPPQGEICVMRGPYDIKTEVEFLQHHRIDTLVVHNAGGQGGWPKLAAARALGLGVILIDRPELPNIQHVETVKAALDWVAARTGLDLWPANP